MVFMKDKQDIALTYTTNCFLEFQLQNELG